MVCSSTLFTFTAKYLTKPSPNYSNQCKIWKLGFKNFVVHEPVDELFNSCGYATAVDVSKIDDIMKNPWDLNDLIQCFKSIYRFPNHLVSFGMNLTKLHIIDASLAIN